MDLTELQQTHALWYCVFSLCCRAKGYVNLFTYRANKTIEAGWHCPSGASLQLSDVFCWIYRQCSSRDKDKLTVVVLSQEIITHKILFSYELKLWDYSDMNVAGHKTECKALIWWIWREIQRCLLCYVQRSVGRREIQTTYYITALLIYLSLGAVAGLALIQNHPYCSIQELSLYEYPYRVSQAAKSSL